MDASTHLLFLHFLECLFGNWQRCLGVAWGIVGGAHYRAFPLQLPWPCSYPLRTPWSLPLPSCCWRPPTCGGRIWRVNTGNISYAPLAPTLLRRPLLLDGYEMNKQGKAGLASRAYPLYSGVIGSLVGLSALVLLSEPLARLALGIYSSCLLCLGGAWL